MKKRIKKEKKPTFPVREVDGQLHAACRELNIGHIRAAIEAGADVNAPNETHEFAPLDIVAQSLDGWDDYRFNPDYQRQIRTIVEILLSHGANPNGIDADERPLVIFAWSCCDPKICAMLLRYGAKVNFEYDEHESVLGLVWGEQAFLSMDDDADRYKEVIGWTEFMRCWSAMERRISATPISRMRSRSEHCRRISVLRCRFADQSPRRSFWRYSPRKRTGARNFGVENSLQMVAVAVQRDAVLTVLREISCKRRNGEYAKIPEIG